MADELVGGLSHVELAPSATATPASLLEPDLRTARSEGMPLLALA